MLARDVHLTTLRNQIFRKSVGNDGHILAVILKDFDVFYSSTNETV